MPGGGESAFRAPCVSEVTSVLRLRSAFWPSSGRLSGVVTTEKRLGIWRFRQRSAHINIMQLCKALHNGKSHIAQAHGHEAARRGLDIVVY